MAFNFSGGAKTLQGNFSLSAFPYTIHAVASTGSLANTKNLVTLVDPAVNGSISGIGLTGAGGNNLANSFKYTRYLGSSSGIGTTNAYSANTWHGVCGVFANESSMKVYRDGGNKGETTDTYNILHWFSRVNLSGFLRAEAEGLVNPLDGLLSECAIWSAALTDDEIASLAKGFKPTRIRPQSLVFYAPLLRNLQDLKGGLALTNNNGATVADHPRVY